MKVQGCKHIHLTFIIVLFIALLLPFICMPFALTDRLSGGTEPVEFPNVVNNDGSINVNYLSQMGDYFEYHFAFRPQLVTANSLLRNAIFHESGTDQVICGNNGFMYYSGTLDDYFGRNDLSDFELKIIAQNLRIVQDYLESNKKNFCFLVAPNKNSLYPQFMPLNYLKTSKCRNFERLIPYLDKYQINYLNEFENFKNCDEVLYLKEDSHWNNKGALKVANDILKYFNKEEITNLDWITRDDRDGDLYIMEYPSIVGTEQESYASGINDQKNLTGDSWLFTNGNSYEDVKSSTKSQINADSGKSLYMFRDSFANSLIPYLSTAFANATYSKLLPYDIYATINSKCNDVVLERAERNLTSLSHFAPIMPAPIINNFDANLRNVNTNQYQNTCEAKIDGDYMMISGELDDNLKNIFASDDDASVVARINSDNHSICFSAFKFIDEESGKLKYCLRLLHPNLDYNNIHIDLYIELNGAIYSTNDYNIFVAN